MTLERPREARRRARSRRKWLGILALLLPFLAIFVSDILRRGRHLLWLDSLHSYGYLASCAQSALFWGILLHAASRRRGLVAYFAGNLFVTVFFLMVGVQSAFHGLYNIYLSIDGQLHSKSIPWSLFGTLPLSQPAIVAHLVGALLLGALLLRVARRYVRPRRWPTRSTVLLTLPALVAVAIIPVSYRTIQSTMPDMIYAHGLGALVKERLGITHESPDLRVQRRKPEPLPSFSPKPSRPRNVLFILQESQRADVTCSEYDPACSRPTKHSNAVLPNRMPLLQLHANDSTTAISISNLWTGIKPTENRSFLHSVPLIWEYAHASGWDTAYWTSQNLMFGNARLYVQDIPLSHRAVATDLDTWAPLDEGTWDMNATDRAIEEWGELKEPFFAVVHYSNVHFPYAYDENDAPYQPASKDNAPAMNTQFFNYYKNVVHLSDKAVAKLVSHVRASESGPRTIIIYTSDHGEAFREHWQLGHTTSLYEEETHVPGFIDAPPGTLSPEEEASIKKAKNEMVWHLDFCPTFLDLIGIWDSPELAPFRARMMGHPLTRPERTVEPVPMTNCTWVWECGFRNWGLMQGPMKLEAREWDGEYHCFNVLDDPDELTNLGEAACGPLADLARATYHVMPNVPPPGKGILGSDTTSE